MFPDSMKIRYLRFKVMGGENNDTWRNPIYQKYKGSSSVLTKGFWHDIRLL